MMAATIDPAMIPAELRNKSRWLCWRREKRHGKTTKVPLCPSTLKLASVNKPETWGPFNVAFLRAKSSGKVDGVGFVFSADDDVLGVDLDHCIGDDGALTAWAAEVVAAMPETYTEVSPSGRGLHLFLRGKLPTTATGARKGPVEVYQHGRYFTVTGRPWNSSPLKIAHANGELTRLFETLTEKLGPENREGSTEGEETARGRLETGAGPTDEQVLSKARRAANADAFSRLWSGDTGGYPSHSEADLGLCSHLAFWTGDAQQIDRLFRQSGLIRPKWDEVHGRETYGATTIARAIADRGEGYDWKRRKSKRNRRRSGESQGEGEKDRFPLTDTGLAERFAKQHRDKIRYCHPWQKWVAWDGKRWRADDVGAAERLAKETARSILAEAAEEPDDETRDAIVSFARSAESASRRTAMLKLARSEEGIPILPDALDRDPWLFNCDNGTIDLRTGELHHHRQNDLITKLSPVAYLADAESPTWQRFLCDIFNDNAELIGFIQRLAGYCLTADVREQVLTIFHGAGANGKSTLLDAIQGALGGDYAMQAPSDMLMARSNDQHPTEKADLFGRRLVVAIETNEGRRLDEALTKSLTGGDRIRARRMREDFWEFPPTHKLILACNHKPEIRGTDHATWRRVRLVPFNVVFDAEHQDKQLPAKLAAEREGILAWAVAGCLEWQRDGLGLPGDVAAATESYRAEQDTVGEFVAQCCEVKPGARVRAGTLYGVYREWAERAGEPVIPQRAFGRRMTERGFERLKISGIWYTGVGLADGQEEGI